MTYKYPLLALFSATALVGCSDSATTTTTTTTTTTGLQLPANVEVIQDDNATSSSLTAVNMAAYDSADTDYTNAKAEVWIDAGDWQAPLQMADMLMCIMKNTGANLLPTSSYLALVDMSQCGNEQAGTQKGKKTRFAEATVVSTRASNTAPQYVTAYFADGEDENGDGDSEDPGELMQYITDVVVTEGASTANPFGIFTFHFNQDNALDGEYSRGSLVISDDSTTQVGLNFITKDKSVSEMAFEQEQWVSGDLNKDGSGGLVKVYRNCVGCGGAKTWKVNFNSTHANIDTSGTAACYSLDDDNLVPYVYNYNLYNKTTGALVELSAGLEFVHGVDKAVRGYAGQYDHWYGDTVTRKWWMWTEDGSVPTTIYKESDTTVSYTVTWYEGQPTVVGLTLVDPIQFEASFTGITPEGVSGTKTDNLNYEGPGQLWGINWNEGIDEEEGSYSPAYNIADGTSLTDTDGTEYIVKQLGLWKTLPPVASVACEALTVEDGAFAAFTEPTLTTVTKTWSGKPTITEKAKIIHGVLQ